MVTTYINTYIIKESNLLFLPARSVLTSYTDACERGNIRRICIMLSVSDMAMCIRSAVDVVGKLLWGAFDYAIVVDSGNFDGIEEKMF